VFVALGVWLWRPGGWAAKRWGWEGAASWSIGALLVLLAVTAWLPEGQTNGVRMLLQPTSTVLTAAIALAVVLAAYVLVRGLGFLPRTARLVAHGVVILLAIYALAALGVAIRDHAAFASLFQGGAVWQRLPAWLQGTCVGALVLLPIGIAGQVLRIVSHCRRREPLRLLIHQATALVMAFVMTTSGLVIPASGGGNNGGSSATDVAAAYSAYTESRRELLRRLAAERPSDKAASPTPLEERIKETFSAFEALSAQLPRDSFDVAAVVSQVGREPNALFKWVRDRTSYVPYRGSLRGPTGVLMDRRGNSLDRSLLLVALLKATGRNARLAHATLSAESARLLRARAPRVFDDARSKEADGTLTEEQAWREVADKFHLDADSLRVALAKSRNASAIIGSDATAQSNEQAAVLLKVVAGDAVVQTDDPAPGADDHWWVQVADGASWTDLDPTLPDARLGTSLAVASQTIPAEQLPTALHHSVEIRIVVEQWASGRPQERVALAHVLRPSEIFGQSVAVVHLPLGVQPQTLPPRPSDLVGYLRETAAKERQWLPVLRVGDVNETGKAVTTDGRLIELSVATSGRIPMDTSKTMGAITGLLGGGAEDRTPTPTGEWSAEWIEYRIHVPGEPVRSVRRAVFDMVGASTRAAKSPLPPTMDDRRLERSLALLTTTDILLQACELSSEFVANLKAQRLLANREIMMRFGRDEWASQEELLELADRLQDMPSPLYDLALVRHALSPVRDSVFLAAPNVLAMHRGLSSPSPTVVTAFTAIDIVANDVAVHPRATMKPFDVRLRQGTHDTNAETFVLSGSCCDASAAGPAQAFKAAIAAGTPWTSVSTPADLSRLQLPLDAKLRIGSELAAGYVVVAPAAASGNDVGWWRIDPKTGGTLGIGRHGWGANLLEKAILMFKNLPAAVAHAKWVGTVAKLAILAACSLVAISENPIEYRGRPPDEAERTRAIEDVMAGRGGNKLAYEGVGSFLVCATLTSVGAAAMIVKAPLLVGRVTLIAELIYDAVETYHFYHK
jgi:hypothetical protein